MERSFATRLTEWYDGAKRDLPWRKTRDPYQILVSEVMLQQTRAQTVIPYYEKFLERFPTARSLARAPRSAVSVVGLRASDAEREQTAARLYEALREGRLDLAETEERVAAAYAARYRAGLAPLLADLPDSPHGPAALSQSPAPGWAAIWTLLVWRARSLLWPATRAAGPPSRWECRVAAVLTMLAVIWTMVCAVLGAALVAL